MKSLSSVLRKSGHDIYQNILEILVLSVMTSIMVLPGIFLLPVQFGALFMLLTAIPGLASVMYVMNNRLKRKTFKYTQFFKAFKKFYFRALVLGLIVGILIFIPYSSFWYYYRVKTLFSLVVAMFQLYLCAAVLAALIYSLPVMVCSDADLSSSMKISIKLFMDNSLYTLGSLIQILAVSGLLAVTVIGVSMLFAGMFSVFAINLYDNLILKYREDKDEQIQLQLFTKSEANYER